MATGSGARQTAPAFHDNFSFRGAPVSAGASDAVLQIGNSEKSMPGVAARNGKACAPYTPIGAANAAAAPARSNVRRSSSVLSCFTSSDISSPAFERHSAAVGATHCCCGLVCSTLAISEFGSIPRDFISRSVELTFTFAPPGPVDAKVALVAGSIDGWAVWEPYVSHATLKDNARIVADGEGLTPTITFIVASDEAIASKRAAVQDLVQRLNKARLWSLDHLPEYAKSTADLTKLPEDVLLSAYTAQKTSPIVIDTAIVNEVQAASDRATRYGILSKTLDVSKAVDRSFTAASAGSN